MRNLVIEKALGIKRAQKLGKRNGSLQTQLAGVEVQCAVRNKSFLPFVSRFQGDIEKLGSAKQVQMLIAKITRNPRITSYNVCYTKLLRVQGETISSQPAGVSVTEARLLGRPGIFLVRGSLRELIL